MRNIILKKPVLICLYGFPGSGKSYVARNLAQMLSIAHVSTDRIQAELFRSPTPTPQQEVITSRLADYIATEFLRTNVGVIYDTNTPTIANRRRLRELAMKHKASYLLIWLQIDQDSAYARATSRDKRTMEGKYAASQTRSGFNQQLEAMQNPKDEDYLVVSGKHTFASQKSAIVSRLYQMGLVDSTVLTDNVTKPELVNLIPSLSTNPTTFERRPL